jgi:hypothetical protein
MYNKSTDFGLLHPRHSIICRIKKRIAGEEGYTKAPVLCDKNWFLNGGVAIQLFVQTVVEARDSS